MNGLGGLNKSPQGVVVGLVQLQLPVVDTPAQLQAQAERIAWMVGKARRNLGTMDLVVFPEYALHGLSMSTAPELMVRLDGPEVALFRAACIEHRIWGCFSIMEHNPRGNPYNTGLIIDDQGELRLYYRKLHPWVPVEPWEPGNMGIPVCDGPNGSKLALIICHDGMFPEMAREAAYKGAEIILRTAGYTAPIRHAWRITNQANAFQNLAITASVCLCGSDGSFDSMGEAMFCNFDGEILTQGGARPDEIVTAELRPDLVREARAGWGVENNPYQLYHRGYVAVKGGAMDCPYTFMQDMVAGRYKLPWDADIQVRDGTPCGFAPPERAYAGAEPNLLDRAATADAGGLMLRLIATRLLSALPNLAGVVVITFILTRALPGDPAAYFAGAAATQEAIAQVRSPARAGQAAAGAVLPVRGRSGAWRHGLVADHRPAGGAGADRAAAGLAGAGVPVAAAGLRHRAAAGRAGGHAPRQLDRPAVPAGHDGRRVAADLLHRAAAGLRVLFPARLGAVADGPAGPDVLAAADDHRAVPGRYRAGRRCGDVVGQPEAADPAGADDGHLRAGADRAHDARVDAVGAVGRLHPHRTRQRAVARARCWSPMRCAMRCCRW